MWSAIRKTVARETLVEAALRLGWVASPEVGVGYLSGFGFASGRSETASTHAGQRKSDPPWECQLPNYTLDIRGI